MAKIIVARHAESIANTKGIYQGQTYDTGLSSLGKKQAKQLAKAVEKHSITKIISSPLKRTSQTAEVVAKKLNLGVEYKRDIIETNHGDWEGKRKSWIEKYFKEEYEIWKKAPSMCIFPNGESFKDTINRVKNYIFNNCWKGNTLIVTHDNIVRIMVAIATKRPIDDLWQLNIEPATITVFSIKGINGRKELKCELVNENNHLREFESDVFMHAL
jgi:broad specificity phosphatase PhoE